MEGISLMNLTPRKYSWGVCDIENPEHSDFLLFYGLIIGYLSFQLIARTDTLYEYYFENKRQRVRNNNERTDRVRSFEMGLGIALGVGMLGMLGYVFKKVGNN